ncbi:hypothetical protein OB981_29775 [Bacillus cereus]|uniref:Uncharacterized protein n=1 Tax=Bacillus cereus HuB4-4 TaxID=1053211 RepID=A0A9W5QNB4_BACCE|nr:hypothetical protein [Bacillus cereus]EOP79226.1 hypothetical protein IGM_06436 [Bacillus cereus HuB4-4]MCU4864199.1 hypothetical protein [Bacillus cereus]
MDTTYWVEFVKSDDTSDTIIREGRYELRHLTVILNCKRIQLFGIEGEYELKYAIYLEAQGSSPSENRIRIYVE